MNLSRFKNRFRPLCASKLILFCTRRQQVLHNSDQPLAWEARSSVGNRFLHTWLQKNSCNFFWSVCYLLFSETNAGLGGSQANPIHFDESYASPKENHLWSLPRLTTLRRNPDTQYSVSRPYLKIKIIHLCVVTVHQSVQVFSKPLPHAKYGPLWATIPALDIKYKLD